MLRKSWFAKATVTSMILSMLVGVAISCSAAEEETPVAQAAPPTATSAPVTASATDASVAPTATPTPAYDTTLYGSTYYKREQNVESEALNTRPVITQEVIDAMPLMKIEEVTKWIPLSLIHI